MSEILKIAIMALGGQGGGVLSGWITELALAQGFHVQTTSVAGVAQRTGATIYYIEMAPGDGPKPVMALAPAKADVDILLAAEWMEAGRAVVRGFVTPDRTTLIASTHRAYATVEKTIPGDGRADDEEVRAGIELAAKRIVAFDMEAMAKAAGSVISAALFGALAGAKALPFETAAFERVIEASGRGVEPSLRAFREACQAVDRPKETAAVETHAPEIALAGPSTLQRAYAKLGERMAPWPEPLCEKAGHGLARVVDFQDLDYGRLYLDRLARVVEQDRTDREYALSVQAAKYIANAMVYDDIIAVADRKTRAARLARIDNEADAPTYRLTEYFHPRAEEIVSLMPAKLGEKWADDERWHNRLDRWFNRGRRIRSDGAIGFTILYAIAGLRRWRPKLFRHRVEQASFAAWYETALSYADRDYDLAVEIFCCRRLIKGYADTHSRSLSKFDKVMAAIPAIEHRADAAAWLRRLRLAALKDPDGNALEGALQTVASLAEAA